MSRTRDTETGEPVTLTAFGAPWCAPWHLIQPMLDRLEADGITVRRVDVNADPAEAEKHRVISLPTLILSRGEQERRRVLGAISEAELRSLIARRQAPQARRRGRR